MSHTLPPLAATSAFSSGHQPQAVLVRTRLLQSSVRGDGHTADNPAASAVLSTRQRPAFSTHVWVPRSEDSLSYPGREGAAPPMPADSITEGPPPRLTKSRHFSFCTVINVQPPFLTQKRNSGLEDRTGTGSLSLAETHLLTDALGPGGCK